jgi:serine/threonine protein kinase
MQLLYPYISGPGEERDDFWPGPGHGFLHLGEVIYRSLDGKLFVADVLPTGTTIPDSTPKRFKTESIAASVETTASPLSVQRVVVKYVTECRGDISLIKEYSVRKIINETSISPKVYYLSPAGLITSDQLPLGTTRFMGINTEKNIEDYARRGASVRFMIQEQAGPSLDAFARYYKNSRSPMFAKGMLKIIRRLLDRIKCLHSFGILHGNIHAENIVYQSPVKTIGDINKTAFRLIDFAHAVFFSSQFDSPIDGKHYSSMNTKYLSPWQLAGERMGPRDDIYQLVIMLGDLLSKRKYRAGIERVFGLADDLEQNVAQKLLAIQIHVINTYVHPDMEIDYAFIKAALDEVIALFP